MVKALSPKQIDELAAGALDAACRHIQDAIRQTDGGRAGVYFSGSEAAEILGIFSRYIEYEQLDAEPEQQQPTPPRHDAPTAVGSFASAVKRELRALRELGVPVPAIAFQLASDRTGMADYLNMGTQECADLLRDLAALPGAGFAAPALNTFHTGGGCMALHVEYPHAKGAYAMITEGDGGASLPDDPEEGSVLIGVYTDATPDGTLITLVGREGLNDWFEANIGYRPDAEPEGPLPIERLMALVAEAFFIHVHGKG